MGSSKRRSKKKKRKNDGKVDAAARGTAETNADGDDGTCVRGFVKEHAFGCHVAFGDAPWVVGTEAWERSEWMGDSDDDGDDEKKLKERESMLPDISIDPETRLLTLLNPDTTLSRVFYVTLMHVLLDDNGRPLQTGVSRDAHGHRLNCTTVIAVLYPKSVMDIAYISTSTTNTNANNNALSPPPSSSSSKISTAPHDIEIYSDVRPTSHIFTPRSTSSLSILPSASSSSLPLYHFPLAPPLQQTQTRAPAFLCTQGFGGCLTHFLGKTRHAVDLSAAVGTFVLAAGAGVVHSVQHRSRAGGIDVRLLFQWNSIMLRLDDGNFAEYVHIRSNSSRVRVGQRVQPGQVLCESGDVGFCPAPHLHFTVYASDKRDADTIPFAFTDQHQTAPPFIPVAGSWYNHQGLINPPPASSSSLSPSISP